MTTTKSEMKLLRKAARGDLDALDRLVEETGNRLGWVREMRDAKWALMMLQLHPEEFGKLMFAKDEPK